MSLPILYSFRRCPYAMRARLALDASGQACELREIALRNKPEHLLNASPKGTVPVLIDVDGTVIDESRDIMLWALRRNDPERWLAPQRGSLADMLRLIDRFDTEFKPCLDRYKYPDRHIDTTAAHSRAEASEHLNVLEERLGASQCLYGDRAALADMALVSFVRQFANVDPEWFASCSWTRLQRWLDAIVGSSRFVRIMRPVGVWTPGEVGVRFPDVAR